MGFFHTYTHILSLPTETSNLQASNAMAIVPSSAGQRRAFNDTAVVVAGSDRHGSNSAAAIAIANRNIGNDRAVTSRDAVAGGTDFSSSQHVTSVRTYINEQISPLANEFLQAGANNREYVEVSACVCVIYIYI